MLLVLAGTHVAVAISIREGTMDPYTLTVVIHQALLLTGAQAIHLLTFQRRSWHRWLYVGNTLLTIVEFAVSNLLPTWINRNSNYCPTLTDAILVARKEREHWTVFLLVVSFLFSLADVIVSKIDAIRNKDLDRNRGDHSIPTLPRWILWERKLWNRRRKAYLTIGLSIYLFLISNVELNIIRYFHEAIQQIDGLSSSENTWGFGQVSAVLVGPAALGFMVHSILIKKLKALAKMTRSVKPE